MIDKLQARYGFTRMPFGRDLAPGMLHRHAAHNEACARITWCIAERAIGVITGEVGAGKTASVRTVLASLDASRHTIIYLPNPMIGIRGLHEMIVATFGGQPDRSYSRLTAQAAAMLAAEREYGGPRLGGHGVAVDGRVDPDDIARALGDIAAALGGDAVVPGGLVGGEDGAPRGPGELAHGVQEEIQHPRDVEAGRERLGELPDHARQDVGGEIEGRPRIVGRHRRLDRSGRGAQRRYLLDEAKLFFRLAQHALEMAGGKGLKEHEVRVLDGRFVVRLGTLGRQYAHNHRGGAELAGALNEGGHVAGRGGVLHDQVDGGEAERPEAFLVRVRGEHRPAVQAAAKTRPQCLVGRDQESRSHVGIVAGRSLGAGNSIVNVQPGLPVWLRTRRVARWASAMLLQMARPNPEPRAFEVMNGLKILSMSSGGTPGPVSEISIRR